MLAIVNSRVALCNKTTRTDFPLLKKMILYVRHVCLTVSWKCKRSQCLGEYACLMRLCVGKQENAKPISIAMAVPPADKVEQI